MKNLDDLVRKLAKKYGIEESNTGQHMFIGADNMEVFLNDKFERIFGDIFDNSNYNFNNNLNAVNNNVV